MAMINPILSPSTALQGISQNTVQAGSQSANPAASFAELMDKALAGAESAEASATADNMALLGGDNINIHSVVLAAEKAEIALRLTMQIRNKVLDAYNEIMRLQI